MAGTFPSFSSVGRPGSGGWYYNVVVETVGLELAVDVKRGSGELKRETKARIVGRLDERTFAS